MRGKLTTHEVRQGVAMLVFTSVLIGFGLFYGARPWLMMSIGLAIGATEMFIIMTRLDIRRR